jgi:hypothetical protein
LRLGQCGIDILTPLNRHVFSLVRPISGSSRQLTRSPVRAPASFEISGQDPSGGALSRGLPTSRHVWGRI